MIVSRATCQAPSASRPTLNVVPPTSVAMMFGWPTTFDNAPIATIPAAGPDSIVCTGTVSSAVRTPPLACRISSGAARPRLVSCWFRRRR